MAHPLTGQHSMCMWSNNVIWGDFGKVEIGLVSCARTDVTELSRNCFVNIALRLRTNLR